MSDQNDALARIDAAVQAFGQEERSLRDYLETLSVQLATTCSRADIRCSGENVVLEGVPDEDWVFGHLYCNHQGLHVLSAYSGDVAVLPPGETVSYSVHAIQGCPVAWLRVISRRDVIEAFLAKVREELLRRTDELRTRLIELATVALPADRAAADDFRRLAEEQGFDRLAPEWRNAQAKAISEPETAVRIACTMIESVCKHILQAKGETPKGELDALFKATRQAIALDPDPKVNDPIQRLVNGLVTATQAIGTFRNRASDAHGTGATPLVVTSHHARLAVNASGAIVTFLLERWKAVNAVGH